MNRHENQFLAGSYSPVGCAPTEPPAEIKKAGNKRKKPSNTPRTEPPNKKARKGDNKENSSSRAGKCLPEEKTDTEIQRQVQFMIKHFSPKRMCFNFYTTNTSFFPLDKERGSILHVSNRSHVYTSIYEHASFQASNSIYQRASFEHASFQASNSIYQRASFDYTELQ